MRDLIQARQDHAEAQILETASCIDGQPWSPSPREQDVPGATGVHGSEGECTSVLSNATVE